MWSTYRLSLILWLAWGAFSDSSTAAPSGPSTRADPQSEASRVVILANAGDRASIALAQSYADARNIPAANIISLSLPSTESVSWKDFIRRVWTPLQERLVSDGWMDAVATTLVDPLGRRKWAVLSHRLSYLVICKGVPLRIEHDPELFTENHPITRNPQFRHNTGAVDSELALLAFPQTPINGFVPNPLFNSLKRPFLDAALVIKVSRLDGPSYDDARSLFESALRAEREGLIGRFWVDAGGPHASGDRWLDETAVRLAALGYSGEKDTRRDTLSAAVRADELAWYFGWYSHDIDGPFRLPGFRFAPGAIALHIHSFSATTLSSPIQGWSGPLVTRGVAGTFGNVAEPYLEFSPQPQKVLEALSHGLTFGDAAFYALTALSWQAIALGDPLYRPFARSPEEQWARRSSLPPARAAHLAVRRQNLARAGSAQEGKVDGEADLSIVAASPASLVALADLFELHGETKRAGEALKQIRTFAPSGAAEWGLFAQAAERLGNQYASPETAVEVWKRLLSSVQAPTIVQIQWLTEAVRVAQTAGRIEENRRWGQDLATLKAATSTGK
jgi:uncharacterized protein (TIGR03790 family)